MAALNSEEEIFNRQKMQRLKRRDRLLVEWENAEQSQRSMWIANAAKRQTATTLQQIIAREKPTSSHPKFQVLDEIAFELSLQPVSEPNATISLESQKSPPPGNQTPQKEKTSTEMAAF